MSNASDFGNSPKEIQRRILKAYTANSLLTSRIEALEADLKVCEGQLEENTITMDTARARIEALEAALQQSVDDWRERGRRIEALEFEVEHERYNVEKTAQEAAKRIKVLEAALKDAGELLKLANEAEQLLNAKYAGDMSIAGAWHFLQRVEPALRQAASKTQPPPFNPDDWGDPSSPPEASD